MFHGVVYVCQVVIPLSRLGHCVRFLLYGGQAL